MTSEATFPNNGLTLLKELDGQKQKKGWFEDKDGYRYELFFANAERFNSFSKLDVRNPFSTYNLKLFLKKQGYSNLLVESEYCGANINVCIHCKKCHDEFFVKPRFVFSNRFKGCPYHRDGYGRKPISEKYNLAKKAPHVMKYWDYERNNLNPNNTSPKSGFSAFWICDVCGHSWEKTIIEFVNGKVGCPKCYQNKNKLSKKYPELLVEWDYSKNKFSPNDVSWGSSKKAWWVCGDCGHSWKANISSRTSAKTNCPVCRKSKGELYIERFLINSGFIEGKDYFRQYKFTDKKIKNLSFDFYLPEHNILIEYNGEQHYFPVQFGGISKKEAVSKFGKQKERDNRKLSFCNKKSIYLLVISYEQIDDIEEILEDILGGL